MFRNKKSKENSRLQDNEDNASDKRVKIVDIQRLIKLKSGQVVSSVIQTDPEEVR